MFVEGNDGKILKKQKNAIKLVASTIFTHNSEISYNIIATQPHQEDYMNKFSTSLIILAITIFCLLPLNQSFAELSLNSSKTKESKHSPKLSQNLAQLIEAISNSAVTREDNQNYHISNLSNPLLQVDDNGHVEVHIHCNQVSNENLKQLQSIGLIVEDMNDKHKIVHGWIPYQNLEQASEMGFVAKVALPDYAQTKVGPITTEGDSVLDSDDVRDILGFDGTGVTIGVISDGVDGLGFSQATGELPGFVNVGSNANGGNEGTAMLEIIHDIAPGASLAFHTAFPTSVQFLNAIDFFISIDADIIVDDIGFLRQPYFQDGELAQAAQAATELGIAFFSAAGNDANRHYQAFYLDDGGLDPDDDLHNFGAAAGEGNDVGLTMEIPGGGTAAIFLQWSDPFSASSNDYDLYAVDSFTGEILNPAGQGIDFQDGNDDPSEFVIVDNPGFGSLLVDIIINKFSGTAQTLELQFNLDGSLLEYNVPEDAIFGHPAAPGVIATAAFDWMTPNTIESFSSRGPVSIISPSDADISSRAAISELRQKPELSGPDGVSTSASGFETFFGTSAAAPHAAAVGALVLEALNSQASQSGIDPSIATRNVQAIETALTSTAVDLGQPGFDTTSGFGRINAFAAVQSVLAAGPSPTPSPTATSTPTPTASAAPTPTGQPTASPNSQPPGNNNGDSGGGCSLQGPIAGKMINAAVLNLIVLFIPALVFGASIMIKRRKDKKI